MATVLRGHGWLRCGPCCQGGRTGQAGSILLAQDGLVAGIQKGQREEMPLVYQKGPQLLSCQG